VASRLVIADNADIADIVGNKCLPRPFPMPALTAMSAFSI
jgi:hypothetical protein